ncbi:response regulator transcription factor [Streptomyces sp. NPDC021020]|uniref:response regulator transcription factor n=1 Tax=Streptomyces sp. NPDC021020 TaxID=3365109 RepID=UPI00378D6731
MKDLDTGVLETLSDREREVLVELASGSTYAAIARRMQLSPHTVDSYLRRIRAKTGAHNRVQLVIYALFLTSQESAARS